MMATTMVGMEAGCGGGGVTIGFQGRSESKNKRKLVWLRCWWWMHDVMVVAVVVMETGCDGSGVTIGFGGTIEREFEKKMR